MLNESSNIIIYLKNRQKKYKVLMNQKYIIGIQQSIALTKQIANYS